MESDPGRAGLLREGLLAHARKPAPFARERAALGQVSGCLMRLVLIALVAIVALGIGLHCSGARCCRRTPFVATRAKPGACPVLDRLRRSGGTRVAGLRSLTELATRSSGSSRKPSLDAVRGVLKLVVSAWNAYALEQPLWGEPGSIDGVRASMLAAQCPPKLLEIFDARIELRATEYGSDL